MPNQPAGPGRPKGSQNKITRELREMVQEALEQEGGVDLLRRWARDKPEVFVKLLAKCIPQAVEAEVAGDTRVEFTWSK